jgi:hypothetical protein
MKFAFLFLTYDNIYNFEHIIKFVDKDNLYIHPKFPNNINSNLKKYVISDLVKTEWGEYSIVKATINLLQEASKNPDNTYFVLLSSDSYPIYDKKTFIKNFNKLTKNKVNNSCFNFLGSIRRISEARDTAGLSSAQVLLKPGEIENFYKTSQWWILSRNDVQVILDTESKYFKLFQYRKIKSAAIDELYFLTVLMMEDKNYKYTNCNWMYTKWKKYVFSMHPAIINKITDLDLKEIKKNKGLFIRKVTDNFDFIPIKYNKMLCIITIGTETNQKNVDLFMKENKYKCDFIIFSFINADQLKVKLDNVLYIYNIQYKFFYNNVLELCVNSKELLKKYINGILFITERFNLDLNINNNFINDKIMNDTKNILYNILEDKYKNQAYYTLFFSSQFMK